MANRQTRSRAKRDSAAPRFIPGEESEMTVWARINTPMVEAGLRRNRNGSARSVVLEELYASMVGVDPKVVVIDDGRSFEHSCKMRAASVDLTTSSDFRINPLAEEE